MGSAYAPVKKTDTVNVCVPLRVLLFCWGPSTGGADLFVSLRVIISSTGVHTLHRSKLLFSCIHSIGIILKWSLSWEGEGRLEDDDYQNQKKMDWCIPNNTVFIIFSDFSEEKIRLIKTYLKAVKLFKSDQDQSEDPQYSEVKSCLTSEFPFADSVTMQLIWYWFFYVWKVIEINLNSIVPHVSGPKRPQDRVEVNCMKKDFHTCLKDKVSIGFPIKQICLSHNYLFIKHDAELVRVNVTL